MKKASTLLCLLVLVQGLHGAQPETQAASGQEDAENPTFVGNLLGVIEKMPALQTALENSGFTVDELKLLFGEKNLFGDLISNVYKLSPLAQELVETTAKTNVELRVILDLSKGKAPNLFDIFKLASSKSENMFNAVDNTAATNPYAQTILQKMKEPNPNVTHIFSLITNRTYSDYSVLDDSKYAVGSSSNRKNRHLFELFKFIEFNWRNLERAGRTFANMPPDYRKILRLFCSLDYSPFQFALGTSTDLNSKKYQLSNNNKNKYDFNKHVDVLDKDVDADIIQLLHQLRVTYPMMSEELQSAHGNDIAREAVYKIIEQSIDIFNRLLGDSDVPSSTDSKFTFNSQ